jgi:hypothetical protein
VAIAHNHLVLARDLVEIQLRPWENKQKKGTMYIYPDKDKVPTWLREALERWEREEP